MGLGEAGFLEASVSSADAIVTVFSGKRLGNFFWTGKISIMLDTCYYAVLGIYDLRHL